MVDLASIPALGTTPVPGNLPAGESLRYDPDYEAVSAEIAKLGTPDVSTIDWKVVVNRSAALLERTKDLFLATALTTGLLMTHGMAGFTAGLTVTHGIVVTFWNDLFPARTRMRARTSSFEWLSERVTGFLNDPANSAALDPVQVKASVGIAEALFTYCSPEKLEGEDSGLGGLLRSLREANERSGGGAPAAENSDADGGAMQGSTSGVSSHSGGGMAVSINVPSAGAALNPAGMVATRDEAFRRLGDLADFFTKAEPLSPVGPLLRRAANWGKMSYQELYTELLAQNRDARQLLLNALGIKSDGSESSS